MNRYAEQDRVEAIRLRAETDRVSSLSCFDDRRALLELYDAQSRELAMVWSLLNSSMSWVRSDTSLPSAEAIMQAFERAASASVEVTP